MFLVFLHLHAVCSLFGFVVIASGTKIVLSTLHIFAVLWNRCKLGVFAILFNTDQHTESGSVFVIVFADVSAV